LSHEISVVVAEEPRPENLDAYVPAEISLMMTVTGSHRSGKIVVKHLPCSLPWHALFAGVVLGLFFDQLLVVPAM